MKQIFLAPRSNETSYKNFESTIMGGRKYEEIESYLNQQEKVILSKYPVVSIWGNKASLRSRWERMRPGDYVLFYARGSFYFSSTVILTKYSVELGSKLWPLDEDGNPWPCLFFVENIQKVDIPIRTIQELAEYESTWDRVQGFMRLNDEGTKAIADKFGSVEVFLSQKPEVYKAIENILESHKDEIIEDEKTELLDIRKILEEANKYQQKGNAYEIASSPRKIRIESRLQKKRIAAIENYSCQVCGWNLEWTNSKGKKSYRIDVDHVVDKAKGGTEEAANLWVLCPNCHAKKTVGVIKIDLNNKKVYENDEEIKLDHDNHLNFINN